MKILQDKLPSPSLIYIHDPMCSWCWGFRSALEKLLDKIPSNIEVIRLVGGLAPDSDQPMPIEMQQYLRQTWMRIQETIPETQFNFEFWEKCQPRRSTYPACRAVIAARSQGPEYDLAMTFGIQQAYYLQARNPSDDSILLEIAVSIRLDPVQFETDLTSDQTQRALTDEINFVRELGVQGFPSLLVVKNEKVTPIAVNMTDPEPMLRSILGLYQSAL